LLFFAIILIFILCVAPLCLAIADTYSDLEITIANDGRSTVTGSSNVPIADIPANETINGFTDSLTAKRQNVWTFNLTTTQNVNVSFIKIHLPQNVVINQINSLQTSNIEYDDSITITFVGKGQPLSIGIQYSFTNSSGSNSDSTTGSSSSKTASYGWYALTAAAILALIGAGTFFYKTKFGRGKSNKSSDSKQQSFGGVRTGNIVLDDAKLSAIRPTLNETQIKIIDALISSGGVATQNKIHHATQIPKASLSRNVDLLVQKQVLQKLSGGYTNQLSFADNLTKL